MTSQIVFQLDMHNYSIYFLVRSYKAFSYFDQCIDSIFKQKNKNYKIIFIDDASDYTDNIKKYIRKKLDNHIIIFNKTRKYSLRNAVEAINEHVPNNAIVINLDGDDWLIGDDVIDIVLSTYNKTNCELTYGNCRYFAPGTKIHDKTPLETTNNINRRYSPNVEKENSYRLHYFQPLHLRTWKASAFKKIDHQNFLRPNGTWIKFCEDEAIFFPLLEQSRGNYQIIQQPLYSYNLSTPLSDDKVNLKERLRDEIIIRKKSAK